MCLWHNGTRPAPSRKFTQMHFFCSLALRYKPLLLSTSGFYTLEHCTLERFGVGVPSEKWEKSDCESRGRKGVLAHCRQPLSSALGGRNGRNLFPSNLQCPELPWKFLYTTWRRVYHSVGTAVLGVLAIHSFTLLTLLLISLSLSLLIRSSPSLFRFYNSISLSS